MKEQKFQISPSIGNYFIKTLKELIGKDDKDRLTETFLEAFLKLYGSTKQLACLDFESELDIILKKKDDHPFKTDEDINAFWLFISLSYLILEEFPTSKVYLDKSDITKLPSDPDIFKLIYNVMLTFFKQPDSVNDNKSRVIISRRYDNLSFLILKESLLKKPSFIVEDSVSRNDLHELFSTSPYLFICGHGGDGPTEGLQYYHYYDKYFRLNGELLSKYGEKFKILGLLSCGIEPYKPYLKYFNYIVIPDNTATFQYTEMFIKTFQLVFRRKNDMLVSIKLALASLMLRSTEEIGFSVFNKGDLITL